MFGQFGPIFQKRNCQWNRVNGTTVLQILKVLGVFEGHGFCVQFFSREMKSCKNCRWNALIFNGRKKMCERFWKLKLGKWILFGLVFLLGSLRNWSFWSRSGGFFWSLVSHIPTLGGLEVSKRWRSWHPGGHVPWNEHKKSGVHQLIGSLSHYLQDLLIFFISQVVQNFFHQQ